MLGDIVIKGMGRVLKEIEKDAKQQRFAAWTAFNKCVTIAKDDTTKHMREVFDRPTPFIMRSLRGVYSPKPARRSGPIEGGVSFKDVFGKNEFGEAVSRILTPHIEGGSRPPKPGEKLLRRAGLISGNEYLIPSRTAPLDRYGNIKPGIMQKITSDLRAHRDAGYTANVNLKKRDAQYVIGNVGGTRGIYKIDGGLKNIHRGRWRLIFLIVKGSPKYRAKFKFYEVAGNSFQKNYPAQFDIAYSDALRTAR